MRLVRQPGRRLIAVDRHRSDISVAIHEKRHHAIGAVTNRSHSLNAIVAIYPHVEQDGATGFLINFSKTVSERALRPKFGAPGAGVFRLRSR